MVHIVKRTTAAATMVAMMLALRAAPAADPRWAYQVPSRPPLPEVADKAWPRQPTDTFIAARLAKEGLASSPEADRRTLMRRTGLALTGLPPAPEEVEAFLADQSPDAYERLVDRLLASPRYGERMAVPWLDLARYADTHGYHSDSEREMWPWRDWVIDALNANMPFDQFTIEQLAGDLLPAATLSQRVATGLHRNHMLNDENGAIPAEYLAEYVTDRVATTGTIWLGQTLACARCHDHKYDSITQREFYELFAFFHNVPENGLGGKTGNAPPTILAPTKLQQAELAKLAGRVELLNAKLAARAAAADSEMIRWERLIAAGKAGSRPPRDAIAHVTFDEGQGQMSANGASAGLRFKGNPSFAAGKFREALLCDGQTFAELSGVPNWSNENAFSLAAWVYPTTGDPMTIIGRVDEPQGRRGFELGISDGRPYLRLTHTAGEDEIEIQSRRALKQRQWQHVVATYDGSTKAGGAALYVEGQQQAVETVRDRLRGHIQGDQPLTIARGDSRTFFRGLVDDVQFFARAIAANEAAALAGGEPIQEILAVAAGRRTAEQRAALKRYYLENHDPIYKQMFAELAESKAREQAILRSVPTTMVMQELAEPRPTYVLDRGLYDRPRERVFPGTPAALPPMAAGLPRNRLGLARWLVDPQNPLTGRVAVNRTWQTLFGAGLVRTPDDLGVRGQRPTHPELLDSLAVEFQGSGVRGREWDQKRLVRLMVTSATFRQDSRVSTELAAKDPENLLWARGPRYRLAAEAIRDQALAAAGLVDLQIGGPSVRPYQPELWRELAYDPNDYTAQVFVQSHGGDLYRRSLYTFWKRTAPPANLSLLDAPDRETCTVARGESNSPLGLLVLLNDVTFVEAARNVAARAVREAAGDASRIDRLMLLVVSRPASERERQLLLEQLADQRMEFRNSPAAAAKLVAVGESPVEPSIDPVELAAWTMVGSTVLNLDEAVSLR
jgi:hypothetical protein